MGSNPSKFTGDPFRPVDSVSWNDAQAFIRSLNEMAGLTATEGYRLPTEAEWEYAARAGTTGPFYFDADPEELVNHAWFDQNASKQTHPVAQKTPNPWGLYDIYGNVWEWVQDYIADFPLYAQIDPTGPIKGSKRVVRGGCYMNGNYRCNSYARGMLSPSQRKSSSGFRLAKSVVIELKA